MHAATRSGARAALLALALSIPAVARGNDPGSAGFLSLRLGAGARSAGMGDAQVSLAEDATATYWNPAGLAAVQGTSFTLMHDEWIESVRMETASLAHCTALGTFGLHFSGMYMDEIPRFTTASGSEEGSFNFFEIAVSAAYGRRLVQDLDIGVAVKGLHGEIDALGASGWAADFGARYRTRITGLTFGGAVQNLGPKLSYVQDEFLLPLTARAGADYRLDLPRARGSVVAAFDLVFPTDADVRQHVGLEYAYRDLASLRVGYKGNYDSQGLTFGVGVKRASYRFDYAFADIQNDLGHGHKIAFSIDL
jgi:hypothetical protein